MMDFFNTGYILLMICDAKFLLERSFLSGKKIFIVISSKDSFTLFSDFAIMISFPVRCSRLRWPKMRACM